MLVCQRKSFVLLEVTADLRSSCIFTCGEGAVNNIGVLSAAPSFMQPHMLGAPGMREKA